MNQWKNKKEVDFTVKWDKIQQGEKQATTCVVSEGRTMHALFVLNMSNF
jgi:hypothetical protein